MIDNEINSYMVIQQKLMSVAEYTRAINSSLYTLVNALTIYLIGFAFVEKYLASSYEYSFYTWVVSAFVVGVIKQRNIGDNIMFGTSLISYCTYILLFGLYESTSFIMVSTCIYVIGVTSAINVYEERKKQYIQTFPVRNNQRVAIVHTD